jgi:hypothetical protein
MLRSSGFSFSELERLRAPGAAHAAAAAVRAERALMERRRRAFEALTQLRRATANPASLRTYRRAEARLKRLRPLGLDDEQPPVSLREWDAIAERRIEDVSRGEVQWEVEAPATRKQLADIASDPAFGHAVFVNSPTAEGGVRRFLHDPGNGYCRRMTMRYLQSFAGKCETASTYGPLNWGIVEPRGRDEVTVSSTGDGRSARRRLIGSYWMVEALVQRLLTLRPGLARLYRSALVRSDEESSEPSGDELLLRRGDGTVCLGDLARDLKEVDVFERARHLEEGGLVRIGLLVPAYEGDPLAALRRLLSEHPAEVPADFSAFLDDLDAWLRAMETAPLATEKRLRAEGEAAFTSVTSIPARRTGEKFGGDRAIFWEEAVGNVSKFALRGAPARLLARGLATPLDILATEAVEARMSAHETLRSIVPAAERIPVLAVSPMDLPDYGSHPLERWRRVVPDVTSRVAHVTREEAISAGLIRPDLAEWPLFCAADVMIGARDAEAVAKCDFEAVLSEAHHILPPSSLPFRTFHPDADSMVGGLRREVEQLVPSGRIAMYAEERIDKGMDHTPLDYVLVCLDWVRQEPRSTPVPIAEVELGWTPRKRLAAFARGSQDELVLLPQYPDAEPSGGVLRHVAMPAVDKRPVDLGDHTPRIVVEGVVYQRERWNLERDGLGGLPRRMEGFDDFLALWRWKSKRTMPDEVFVLWSHEAKPTLVDFRSPLSCEAFVRDAVAAEGAVVTEMLPAPQNLWLKHASGRVCSEIRMTLFRRAEGVS